MTRDGCLCLEEFVTAMHLVVLRRNRIEVPDQLPPQLVPKVRVTVNVTAASRRLPHCLPCARASQGITRCCFQSWEFIFAV